MLSELLKDRDLWQVNTITRMKDSLLYKPTSISTLSSGEQLVVVYGPPQIGKTTLILNLLGISKERQGEVYDVLRAGVQRGSSSTSTAIIYQKSPSDLYGVRYDISSEQSKNEVQYFQAEEMIQFLKGVRERVEQGNASKEILYIFLPKLFFSNESSLNENIDILDLPGDGSRNENESDHVQDILRKYLAMASVSIIACKGNEIQSLETLEIQGDLDWRMQPNKYIGVITNAYGQGSIKSYFTQNRNDRSSPFDIYVGAQYNAALQTILPAFCQVKFYPVDMGESLKRLLDSLQLEDQTIVEETLNGMLGIIRDEIMSRQSNTLKGTIDFLRTYSSEYVNGPIEELQSEIEDIGNHRKEIADNISEKKEQLAACTSMISSLLDDYKKILDMENELVDFSYQYYLSTIIDYIINKFGKRISDPEHLIFDKFRKTLLSYLRNLEQQVKYTELCIDDAETVYMDLALDIPFEAEIESFLYPKGLVKKFSKADRDKCIEVITRNFNLIMDSVSKKYDHQKNTVLKQYSTLKERYLNYRQLKIECNREIESSLIKLVELDSIFQIKRDRLNKLLQNKEKDQKVLSEYLKIAEDEFCKQINRCNSLLTNSTREQKAAVIIFMALLGRDYNNLVRGDHYGTAGRGGNR